MYLRRLVFLILAVLALAAVSLAPSTPAEARSPMRAAALHELLPWIAAQSIAPVSADALLASVEKAVAREARLNVASLPRPTGSFADRVAAFEAWLREAVPDAATRGRLLRQGLRQTLAALHEDGTQLYPPNKYMLPPEVEGYDKGGVGLLVDPIPDAQGRFIIFETLEGFPGATLGLKGGDRLVAVGDRTVVGLSYREMADLVRGHLGTRVKLSVAHPGASNVETYEVERVWLNPNPKNISHKILDGGIGYVRVKYLGERLNVELSRVLDEFREKGVRKMVLDLRNNEGILAGTQDVGGIFLGPNVAITKLVSRSGAQVQRTHGAKGGEAPFVVLVNRYTSGAGVLLAAALQHQGHARLVGEPTVWRDQPIRSRELTDGSTVTVANGYYVLDSGRRLRSHQDSLKLDTKIDQPPLAPLGGTDDLQLRNAVDLCRGH